MQHEMNQFSEIGVKVLTQLKQNIVFEKSLRIFVGKLNTQNHQALI